MTKFTAPRLGSSQREIANSRVSGRSWAELVDGEGRLEPDPGLTVAYPQAEVRVAALVAGARMHDLSE